METKIRYSIDDVYGMPSGTQVSLWLIPAAEHRDGVIEITTFAHVGAGVPMPGHNGHWLCLGGLSTNYVAESLRESLEGSEDLWRSISDCYDSERRRWSTEDREWIEAQWGYDSLEEGVEQYWDAYDWLSGDLGKVDETIRDGGTAAEMASCIVADYEGDARLDAGDVEGVIVDRCRQLANEDIVTDDVDLLYEACRIAEVSRPDFAAEWDGDAYVWGPWSSTDGDNWVWTNTGEPVEHPLFEIVTFHLIDGPEDDEYVG